MKRWYLVAVASFWSVAPLSAQQGALAPTAPVVPAPVLQGGSPGGAAGAVGLSAGNGTRGFTLTKWAPFRSPAVASTTEPIVTSAATYGQPVPASALVGGACGAGGCGPIDGHRSHDRMTWAHLKAWMCYHPSNTELPRHRPIPYITPLQGMFPCSSVGGGCDTGCATGCAAPVVLPGGQPQGQPMPPPAQPGPVGAMPSRGTQGGAVPTTWQTRTGPAPTTPGVAGYRYATIPTNGGIVPTGLQSPASK